MTAEIVPKGLAPQIRNTADDDIDLQEVAGRIRQQQAAVEASTQTALSRAMEAGRLLIEAKERVEHGQWAQWVKVWGGLAMRTAQLYMQIAKMAPVLTGLNAQRVAHLSIREILTDAVNVQKAKILNQVGKSIHEGQHSLGFSLTPDIEKKIDALYDPLEAAAMKRAWEDQEGEAD